MDDVIRLTDQYYIAAPSSATEQARVLKHGDSFAIFDPHGDIRQTGLGEQGIYHQGTRYLSHLVFNLGSTLPFLLSSTVQRDNLLLTVDLTNPDVYGKETIVLRRGDLHIFRGKFVWQATCYEWLRMTNYGLLPVEINFSFQFDSDFADIFEVRGVKRAKRGTRLDTEVGAQNVVLAYRGLDSVVRRTEISFDPAPASLTSTEAFFSTVLTSKKDEIYCLAYSFQADSCQAARRSRATALAQAKEALNSLRTEECKISTSNQEFNGWLERSLSDLHMMFTETPFGAYPYAGVPWFSTAFGRDGIITAMQFLLVNPLVARGVLRYLAAGQANKLIPEKDAEPGKILHETRRGEMAALQEIPFDCYYGSTDATPLFIMLAGAYFERTADLEFIESIWPNILRALDWIDIHGDTDNDGFVETMRHSKQGLVQQGWKDSWDSVSHADGSLPEFPLALCEVQGYVYAARLAAARLASALGNAGKAEELMAKAQFLKERFNDVFWCEDLSTYAIALDRAKRPCKIKASNAGHCLFTGIASDEYARRVAQTLLNEGSFSGWGIRTLDASEVRYNPMAYHNGSVWPHDNSLIAAGFARYGLKEEVNTIMASLFSSSLFFELQRLPELFCGFPRREGVGPTLYPVACSPQAWAAGSVFLLLQTCLGLSVDAGQSTVYFTSPSLPDLVEEVRIKDLRVGASYVDLVVDRSFRGVGVQRREGGVNVVLR
ncbi:MAG TPA: amylo-alpha-1,6-glucosidase [Candidatus Binatia bacterium]|nr:amylo-alpha-1,6-glucosidase [Candidatus Binatia bacterium]